MESTHMTADPLSREAALARGKEAGYKAGKWGSKPEHNPYYRKAAFREEEAAWESGRIEGAAARKAGKA